MLLKQLARQHANTRCQELIRPIRKTDTVQGYIKACIDALPAVVQGVAYAAGKQGQHFHDVFQLGMVAHTCILSTWEAEAG